MDPLSCGRRNHGKISVVVASFFLGVSRLNNYGKFDDLAACDKFCLAAGLEGIKCCSHDDNLRIVIHGRFSITTTYVLSSYRES